MVRTICKQARLSRTRQRKAQLQLRPNHRSSLGRIRYRWGRRGRTWGFPKNHCMNLPYSGQSWAPSTEVSYLVSYRGGWKAALSGPPLSGTLTQGTVGLGGTSVEETHRGRSQDGKTFQKRGLGSWSTPKVAPPCQASVPTPCAPEMLSPGPSVPDRGPEAPR